MYACNGVRLLRSSLILFSQAHLMIVKHMWISSHHCIRRLRYKQVDLIQAILSCTTCTYGCETYHYFIHIDSSGFDFAKQQVPLGMNFLNRTRLDWDMIFGPREDNIPVKLNEMSEMDANAIPETTLPNYLEQGRGSGDGSQSQIGTTCAGRWSHQHQIQI